MAARTKDYTGHKYNHLRILHKVRGGSAGIGVVWLVRCDCGNEREASGSDVARGRLKTCGKCELSSNLIRDKFLQRHPKFAIKTYGLARRYSSYVRSALKRGVEWDLTPEQFVEIISKACSYCGEEPKKVAYKTKYKSNGVDRVDSTKGYTLENSVPCCKACNFIKSQLSVEDFIRKCLIVADRFAEMRDRLLSSK